MLTRLAENICRAEDRKIYRKLLLASVILIYSLKLFSQTYNIDDYHTQTINTCSGTFYDSGGAAGLYGNNEDFTVTFCSDNITNPYLKFDFTSFFVYTGDALYIYDGPDTSSPIIGIYHDDLALSPFAIYSSGTCLTFRFTSNASSVRSGWAASISCVACPPAFISPIIPPNIEVCSG